MVSKVMNQDTVDAKLIGHFSWIAKKIIHSEGLSWKVCSVYTGFGSICQWFTTPLQPKKRKQQQTFVYGIWVHFLEEFSGIICVCHYYPHRNTWGVNGVFGKAASVLFPRSWCTGQPRCTFGICSSHNQWSW